MSAYLNALSECGKATILAEVARQQARAERAEAERDKLLRDRVHGYVVEDGVVNYAVIREALAKLSGIPAMSDVTMRHIEIIGEKLSQAEAERDRLKDALTTTVIEATAAIDDLKAERDRLLSEVADLRGRLRWNVDKDGETLLVCRGEHERSEGCEWERYVPEAERDRLRATLADLVAVAWRINDTTDRSEFDRYYLGSTNDWDDLNTVLHKHADVIRSVEAVHASRGPNG